MRLFGRSRAAAARKSGERLYGAVVAVARRPEFFETMGVADTVEGRFEMICLHAAILLRRLKRDGGDTADLAQAVFDAMFADIDRNLREMGVGDLGVGRRVKAMARSFYGRLAAYDGGLGGGADALVASIRRNVFAGGDGDAEGMAAHAQRAAALLEGTDTARLLAGEAAFGDPMPAPSGSPR